jgi:hypothetical protein
MDDEYEYALTMTHVQSGNTLPIYPEDWMGRSEAEAELQRNLKDNVDREEKNRPVFFSFHLVRRRKAGPVEVVE